MKLSVVVPFYNELRTLPTVIDRLLAVDFAALGLETELLIVDGDYQVVYGNRFKGSAAGLYYSHRVANRLLNLMVNVAFNRYLSDVYTGYKVFTREALSGLNLSARTFTVEMELTAHFLRKRLVVFEVPIS